MFAQSRPRVQLWEHTCSSSMRKDVKAFLGFNIVFCSVFTVLTVFLHHLHSASTIIFGVVIPLFLFCLWLLWYLNHRQLSNVTQLVWRSQTEDVESGQEDGDGPEDAPPIYEAVVAKPPPYEHLYGSSYGSSCGEEDAGAGQRMSDCCTDSDLPTYSQVAEAPSPV